VPTGPSGRVVVEIDPSTKRKLHSVLAARGQSLKDWFIHAAETYITEANEADASAQTSRRR
jgi:hypothetical protein